MSARSLPAERLQASTKFAGTFKLFFTTAVIEYYESLPLAKAKQAKYHTNLHVAKAVFR